ncbi:MAG: hypothetical protein H0V96_01415 [Acidimicrobiia bacterium]|nr:hypothetical protein [Acidimicrobiia bacterium]
MIAVTAVLVIAAACGASNLATGATEPSGPTDSSAPPDGTGSTAPDGDERALFTITFEGGFASPAIFAAQGPLYVVTRDGRLIFQGAVPEIFPGPLVPNYQVVDVGDLLPDLEDILDRLGIAEITEEIDTDDGDPASDIAEAPTTVLTYVDGNGTHRYGAYALGFGQPNPSGDRKRVALSDLMMTLDAAAFGGEVSQTYQSDRWQVVVDGDIPADTGVPEDVRPYPLHTAVDEFEQTNFDLPCTVIIGEDAAVAAAAFTDATQVTVWDTGSAPVRLLARPLLPGEDGCANR